MTYSAARGPLTITGAAVHAVGDPTVQNTAEETRDSQSSPLQVVKLETLNGCPSQNLPRGQTHLSAFPAVGRLAPGNEWGVTHTQTVFVRQGGSDCILSVLSQEGVPPGVIALTELQRHNLHLADQESYDFSIFAPPPGAPLALTDVLVEVRLLPLEGEREGGEVPRFDAVVLKKLVGKQSFGRVVAVGEMLVLFLEGREVAFRVDKTNNLEEEERMAAVVYHCYRGLLTHDTRIHLRATESVVLENNEWEEGHHSTAHLVNVYTSDDEVFPVKKSLLRPCIALTKAVHDCGPEAPCVHVDISCPIFDRILLYLEADAMQRVDKYDFDINLNESMLDAAKKLGLRGAVGLCERKMGDFESRIREYSLSEIKERNGHGECWLIIDCMVLDVTKWLPEHPGGSTIIPEQALNVDCACFFELYHVSRESFLYLKVPTGESPSEEFLRQLRDYSDFRMHQKDFISL